MNNNDYKEKLKMKIAMYNAVEDIKNNYLQKNNKKRRDIFMKKKLIATACASLVLVSGVALAANIVNNKQSRGLGKGIDTAIENGYIAEPNINFINSSDIGIEVTLKNFLMDDMNLSTNLIFDFDDTLKETINIDKIYEVELNDLIVRDEENRIIYGGNDKERFEAYCVENNLEYKFSNFNESYMSSGVNCFIESKGSNHINLLYNMYSDKFPKSKKLYFSFTKISIAEIENNKYIVDGNWEIEVDVPEEMYNRTEDYYKVISCDNSDFNVYAAKATNTGFEIGVIISNIEEPKTDMEKLKKYGKLNELYENKEITYEEAMEIADWYNEWKDLSYPISIKKHNAKGEETNASYVKNENGEIFEYLKSATRNTKTYFIDGNKYDFYETFEMTKYESTDKIKVVLYYYGNPVNIELEKIYN